MSTATTTAQQAIDMVNQAQGQTGVVATHNGTAIIFNTTGFGSNSSINLTDANGVVRVGGAAGTSSASGADAVATVTVNGVSALFTGGVAGRDGLSLSDADGNHVSLTGAGN